MGINALICKLLVYLSEPGGVFGEHVGGRNFRIWHIAASEVLSLTYRQSLRHTAHHGRKASLLEGIHGSCARDRKHTHLGLL